MIEVPDLDTDFQKVNEGEVLFPNSNTYRIDEERFKVAVELLKKKIQMQPLQNETTIRFDRGYLWETEGYKYDIYDKCRKILSFENWTPETLETSEITDRLLAAFNKGTVVL